MAGYFTKEANGKWSTQFYYVDYAGVRRRKRKCGFTTKREAEAWKNEFIRKAKANMDMRFETFVEEYLEMISSDIRQSTMDTKQHIIELHILPYFRGKKVTDINALDVKKWQATIKKKGFSDTYLRTINAQLSAIFNYGVNLYNLPYNPARKAGIMGKTKSGNMGIWSIEEMEQFLSAVENKDGAFYAFKLMYWTGIRLGELLALNVGDVDLEEKKLHITKSLTRRKKQDVIDKPKTPAGNRVISLPDFIVDDMREYMGKLYGMTKNDRLFHFTKNFLEHEIKRGAKLANLKEIRVHDLRHSHASVLISNNVDIATIANRLGHENIKTTLDTYSHLFDKNAKAVANTLDKLYRPVSEEE